MDSVSQLALGASIGIALMGRRTAVWKAALWGGVAGTLPDLDVLVDHGDAVLNMVLHRGHSHSLLWTSLAGALLGLLAQAWASGHVHRSLASQGLQAQVLLVTPAPLNTLLWRAVAVQGDHYYEGYYALLDGDRPVRWTQHIRGQDLMQTHADHPHVQRMLRFTDGLMRMRLQDEQLWLTDLRMGQEGAYVFDFVLGRPLSPGQTPPPATQHAARPPIGDSLRWLWVRMWGDDIPAPVTVTTQR